MKRTEKELISSHKENIFLFEKVLDKHHVDISVLDEMLPGIVHINKVEDTSIQFLNKKGCEMYEHDLGEIKVMGNEIFVKHTHPDTIQFEFPKIGNFLEKADEYAVGSIFQQVEFYNSKEYDWVYTSFKKLRGTDCFIGVSHLVNEMGSIGKQFENVLGDNLYLRKHFKSVSTLTKREKEVLKLIANGKTNKEIGEQLFISGHTVKTHRKHIWRKLDVKHLADLIKIASTFDLI